MKEICFYEQNPELFQKLWVEKIQPRALSPRFLYHFIDHLRYFSKTMVKEKSFIFMKDQFVAGVFLPIEKNGEFLEVSIAGSYIAAPFFDNPKIEKEVMGLIDDLLSEEKVDAVRFLADPLQALMSSGSNYNFLRKYGFIDYSVDDSFVKLEKDMWSNVRKGHKSDIKKIISDQRYKIQIVDKSNANRLVHSHYVALHEKCSGRVTRAIKTFDLQYEMLLEGNAFIVSLEFENNVIGSSYFFVSNGGVVYASAADDPTFADEKRVPIHHVILWSALEYALKCGYVLMELCPPAGYSDQLGLLTDAKKKWNRSI